MNNQTQSTHNINDFAYRYHQEISKQRISALNKILSKMILYKGDVLTTVDLIECANLVSSSPIFEELDEAINQFKEDINDAYQYVMFESKRIKAELKIIGKCNNFWISSQPMVCPDDIRRYLDYMTVSYMDTIKNLTRLCQYIEINILDLDDQKMKYLN